MTDYFVWVTIPELGFEADADWEPFIARLEQTAPEAGPILGWDKGEAKVVLGIHDEDEAGAAKRAVTYVSEALHHTRLGDRYPSRVEVEAAEAEELQPV